MYLVYGDDYSDRIALTSSFTIGLQIAGEKYGVIGKLELNENYENGFIVPSEYLYGNEVIV